jgi:uncharacterized membrane protein
MKKLILSILVSTILLLLLSFGMLYISISFFPDLSSEYLSPVFRSAGRVDWMYFVHPLVLSIALKWFWERYKNILTGNIFLKALEVALVYGVVALIPVLWITFSAIDVSLKMISTWLLYGFIQSFAAGIVFAKLNP